jgi:hypothetical protein
MRRASDVSRRVKDARLLVWVGGLALAVIVLAGPAAAHAQEADGGPPPAEQPPPPPPPPEPPAAPPPPPPPAPPPRLSPSDEAVHRVLALCASQEVAPRRFCLEQLMAMGDPQGIARARLHDMAARDPDLHDLAAAAVAHLYRERPPAYQAAHDALWPRDPGRNHLIFFQTAYTTPRRKVSVQIVDLGYWDINYGVTDNLELGLRATPPITVVGFFPQLKLSFPFEGGAFSLHAMGGVFLPYVGDYSPTIGLAGGGPTLSLGGGTFIFNVGVAAYGIFSGDFRGGVLLPYAGVSKRVSRYVSLNLEVAMPGYFDRDYTWMGRLGLILYGIRIMGPTVWGDIAFALPIFEGCSFMYHYLPVGIPLLGFGFSL